MPKLSQLEIWYYSDYNFMTGIRATLTNGVQSPIFKTNGHQNGPITLQLDEKKQIKTLAVRSAEDGVYGLKMADVEK